MPRPRTKDTLKTTRTLLGEDEFLTTQELMSLLKLKHKQTVYKLVAEGLPKILIGNKYRFLKNEVIEHLKQKSTDTEPLSKQVRS